MVTFDDVRALALDLPEVEESTSYGTPSIKVRGKGFVRLREDGETLAVRVDMDERMVLTKAQPDTFFFTPHYANYAWMLVRLAAIDRDELREVVIEAWRLAAPKRLVTTFDAEPGHSAR